MPLNRAEVLGQVRPQIQSIYERTRQIHEVYRSMIGNVHPDHIVRLTDEYEQFLQIPGITDSDKDRWMIEHTSGSIERSLIQTTRMRRETERALDSVNNDITLLATISHPSAHELATGIMSELRNHYTSDLGQADQLLNQFHTIASGITGQDQELGKLEEALKDFPLE